MELKYKKTMNKIAFFILLLCVFTNCSKDCKDETTESTGTSYNFYYPTSEATINANQIGDGTGKLDPNGIAIASDKLYICNGDQLDIFNAQTLKFEKTIKNYTKGNETIPLTKLTSVSVDGGRIYLGSVDSRIFVLDEKTNKGISTVGNGQWWNTFVHVFGLIAKDGLLFVKEKEKTIKVFDIKQITETSNWNIKPIAKLNTQNGFDEVYSMDVYDGHLVVAGIKSNAYLYYRIASIRTDGVASLTTPLNPTKTDLNNTKPIAITFSNDWAITSELIGDANFLRLYPKDNFMKKTYNPILNSSDIMGQNSFGKIVSIAQHGDRIFLSDNSNHEIKIIKIKTSKITEQQ